MVLNFFILIKLSFPQILISISISTVKPLLLFFDLINVNNFLENQIQLINQQFYHMKASI